MKLALKIVLSLTVFAALGTALAVVFPSKETSTSSTKNLENLKTDNAINNLNNFQGTTQSSKFKELNLTNARLVFLLGAIDALNANLVNKQLLSLNDSNEPILMVINSPGGSVIAGASILNTMASLKAPVNTLCVSLCASMAAMIHQYGNKRFMLNRSILMFHPASAGVGSGEVDKMASQVVLLQKYVSEMESHVAKRAKMEFHEYKLRSGQEWWVVTSEALKFNLIEDAVVIKKGFEKLVDSLNVDFKTQRKNEIPNKLPSLDWSL